VREHLETFLTMAREERGKDIPHYVEEELRRYVRCGEWVDGWDADVLHSESGLVELARGQRVD
jgi:hypothetical protein